jgi:inhibitor of cysteine peptidase
MRSRLLSALLLAACTTHEAPPAARGDGVTTIELSEADNGRTIVVGQGQMVAVRLDENPLTGYRWQWLVQPPETLQLVRTTFVAPQPGSPGAAGTRSWLLQAAQGGTAHLRFELRRAWGHEDALKHLEFELRAR